MTPTERLFPHLERVQPTGADSWLALCPAHESDDRNLSIREVSGGRLLLHCYFGCDLYEVISAAGLAVEDLYPEQSDAHPPERRRFSPIDILRAIAYEACVVMVSAIAILDGRPFSEAERARMGEAVARIQSALVAAGFSLSFRNWRKG